MEFLIQSLVKSCAASKTQPNVTDTSALSFAAASKMKEDQIHVKIVAKN